MERIFTKSGRPVSIIKVYVKSKSKDLVGDVAGYAIDIECFDVFLTNFTKKQLEKLCSIVLSSASEIEIYKHIKERNAIIEFSASQISQGSYKVTVGTVAKDYIKNIRSFNSTINIISKSIIERIIHLFTAYSVDSY